MIALRKYFLTGILVFVPLAAAVIILYWVFSYIDNLLQPAIEAIFGHEIAGVGFAVIIVLIFIVGIIASNFIGRRIINFVESLITRIPVFRPLYHSAKQIMGGFAGTPLKKASFREVVLVEFPREGMRTLAFITNQIINESGEKMFCIYVPTTPVPTSGYFEIVTEDMITRTKISVDDALKMIMSGGMIAPHRISTRKIPVKVAKPEED